MNKPAVQRPDVLVDNQGTLFLFIPCTPAAREWIDEHVGADAMYLGPNLVAEHRYVADLAEGMQADGLVLA